MPELPEIETVSRGISHLQGKQITAVIVRNGNLRYKITQTIAKDLLDKQIKQVSRRAKYIIIELSRGYLIMHLGMSGTITLLDSNTKNTPLKHDHVDIIIDNNIILRFNDPRRFGCVIYTEDYQKHSLFTALGPEPLTTEFNPTYLLNRLSNKKSTIKQLIMDNNIVVGVGNIYAAEALFMAKISPLRQGESISKIEATNLVLAIKQVLATAIKQGGSSLRDYKHTDGSLGYFQNLHMVYDKLGKPCGICKTAIAAKRLGQRNSFFCPNCQK
jgi:formamidopyrimidine-DNA glycosylase